MPLTFNNALDQSDWLLLNQIIQKRLRTAPKKRRLSLRVLFLSMIAGVASGVVGLMLDEQGLLAWPAELLPLLLLATPAIIVLLLIGRARKQSLENYLESDGYILGNREVSVEAGGLRLTTTKADSLVYWPSFVSAQLTDQQLLLFLEKNVAHVFSRKNSTERDFDAFLQALREHAPQLADDLSLTTSVNSVEAYSGSDG